MSKELLPELPRHTDEWYDDIDKEVVRTYGEARVRAYGQACYEAGRKSVDLEQFRVAVAIAIGTAEINGWKRDELNRLLAIIDGEKA